jgi:hypothetical protein
VLNNECFRDCTKLETVDLPNVKEMGGSVFSGCSSLKRYVSHSNCHINGSYNFQSCTALEYFEAKHSFNFQSGTFSNCQSLKTIVLRDNKSTSYSMSNIDALKNTPIANGTGYFYVKRDIIEVLKTKTNFVNYASQFRVLEDYTVDGTADGELDPSKI